MLSDGPRLVQACEDELGYAVRSTSRNTEPSSRNQRYAPDSGSPATADETGTSPSATTRDMQSIYILPVFESDRVTVSVFAPGTKNEPDSGTEALCPAVDGTSSATVRPFTERSNVPLAENDVVLNLNVRVFANISSTRAKFTLTAESTELSSFVIFRQSLTVPMFAASFPANSRDMSLATPTFHSSPSLHPSQNAFRTSSRVRARSHITTC